MKLGIFLTLAVLLSCTSANLHPKNAKSDKKTALVDSFLEKKAGIENPADSLKPKDWVKYVEQKVATNLKADEEKTEKKQHENARSNPVLSKLLRPSGSDVTAVKPADLERVSSQHFRQPEQQVEGYIARYGRSSHVDNVMKMQEVMRHVSEISREDPRGDAADMVPDFLRGHNAVQSGSRHDAHEGHAPMVDPEEEKGHEHPYPGVLTGKHSESLHHGLKQTLQGVEHAKAEEASRGSGHEVHKHQKHQESVHGRNPHPVGEELDNTKKQAEESEAKADPTPETAPQEEGKEDAGAAKASSLVEKIRLMQEMAKKEAEESEVTGQVSSSSTLDEGDAENAVPAPSQAAEEKETNAVLAQEENSEDAGAAAANSVVEKIQMMQKMAALAKVSSSENVDPTSDAQADLDDAGAAAASSIVEKIQMMQRMAALAKMMKKMKEGSEEEKEEALEEAKEVLPPEVLSVIKSKLDQEQGDMDKDAVETAERPSPSPLVREKLRQSGRLHPVNKEDKASDEEKQKEGSGAREENPGQTEGKAPERPSIHESPAEPDDDVARPAEHSTLSSLRKESLRESGRLVTGDKTTSDDANPTEEDSEDHKTDARQSKEAGKGGPTMEESPKIILQSSLSEKDQTTADANEETATKSDGPAKALGAIMKAMAIAKAQQDTSASTDAGAAEAINLEEKIRLMQEMAKKQTEESEVTGQEESSSTSDEGDTENAVPAPSEAAQEKETNAVLAQEENTEASEGLKPALTPESTEKKLQVIQAIKHATELANGRKKQPASIEADDTPKNNEEGNLEIANDNSAPKAVNEEEPTSHDEEEAARALEEAIKKAVAIAKEGRQETPASEEAKTAEPTTESKQPPLTPENKEKELQVMTAIRNAMEFAKGYEESSASIEAAGQVAKALDTADPTVSAENTEQENNKEAPKPAPSQDGKVDSDQNAFNVLQQVNELRKLKHMASDEASKNGLEDSQKENNIVDDIGSVDQIANNKPQDEALKDQSKEEKAKRVLDTMAELQAAASEQKEQSSKEKAKRVLDTVAELQAAASNQKKQLNSEEAIAKTEEEKLEDNNLESRSQAQQAIMETIGKIRQEAEERAHEQEKDDPTPEETQEFQGKDIGDLEPEVNTDSSGPVAGDAENAEGSRSAKEELTEDTAEAETNSIVEKIKLMQRMAALAKVVKKMKDGSEEEKEEALEEAKEMLPPEVLSVVQAKIAEESGNQENGKDDMEEETAGESSEAKVEEEIDENQDTQDAVKDTEEERTREEAGGNIEEDEGKVQFKKVESVEGLNLAVAEPEEHLGGTGKGEQTRKESGEDLSKGPEESLAENKEEDQNEENLTEESQILGDVDKAQSVINPQDQDERKFKDSLMEDEDDLSLKTSQESAQRAEEHIKTGHDTEEGTNDDQNDQEDEDVGETKEGDPLTRLANIKATLAHLQGLEEEQQDEKSDETGKEEEDNVAPAEELLPQKPADSTPTKNGKIETRTTQFQETELDEKKNEGEVNVRASQKPADDSMTTKNAKTEARITHDQLQGPENDDEKENELEGEGNEVEHVRVSLSQKAAAAEKVQRKALIAAGIAQSHLKAHGIKAPKSQEQPDEHKHLKGDATSVKKTSYYLSEEGKLRSSDEAHKEAKKHKILKIKNNLLTDGVAKTSQEDPEDVNSGGDKIRSPEELFSKEKETERSAENKGLKPASPFLQGAFMARNTALQGKPDKEHPQSSDRTSKIPPYYLSKEKVMKSSDEFLEEEVLSVGKEEKSPVRPLPKDLARKNKISDKGTKGKISKEVLLTMEDKKKVISTEKKLTGLLSNAADVKKENKTKLDKETKTKTGLKMSAKPKSLFGKAVKAGKHRNLAKLREMAMAMAKKRRLPRGRRN
ncbi:PREDICTED: microtubule-associated protein futsch-like [Branchiostoma belcheri]|uniref:Microtubule-associated protein futsch-like n=1 Tax=Branchiostoma belcheri TaxID=7741 RepID=A0A6P4XRZ9_BRABE|nr:PREDICTED: microtubule-associated protein futsch-like [Branchiostoma belcheri]